MQLQFRKCLAIMRLNNTGTVERQYESGFLPGRGQTDGGGVVWMGQSGWSSWKEGQSEGTDRGR